MPYKVIQWATGAVGTHTLQELIRNARFDLRAVYVYSEGKEGADAGELAGLQPIGIAATRDRQAIIDTDADVVVYTPLGASIEALDDDVIALLSSGKNVVTTAGYYAPQLRGQGVVDRLEAACAAGGSTLYGTGIEPGFMFDRLVPTLTSVCTDIDGFRLTEMVDATKHPALLMMKEAIGIGRDPSEVHRDTEWGKYWAGFFSEMTTATVAALGMKADRLETDLEAGVATRRIESAVGVIEAGQVIGNKHKVTAFVDGRPFVHVEIHWYVGELPEGWRNPLYRYGWHIEIEGRPALRAVIDPLPSLDESRFGEEGELDAGFLGTAATVINAIPEVCAAPAGILHAPVFAPWTPRQTTA
jgi:2,4-diaminopentanoate dehydrogenase